jgi:hypothetical protein
MSTNDDAPPKVRTHLKPNGGVFESINRPSAGATFERDLPKGKHPLQLYSQDTWNGMKVTMLLALSRSRMFFGKSFRLSHPTSCGPPIGARCSWI